jgi:DNA modification methylase
MVDINKIYNDHCLPGLKNIPDQSVHCCVTSPPYWGLRDYGMDGQLGLEKTPEEFIEKLVEVFREVKRVLRDDGTIWVNIGDSYAHNGAAYHDGKSTLIGRKQGTEMGAAKRFVKKGGDLKPKDLVGIPWMLAFALRADGWYLRQDIIWSKPNPMPESVTDRCTKAHEYIFMLSKSHKYYYDSAAIKTPPKNPEDDLRRISKATINGKSTPDAEKNGIRKVDKQRGHSRKHAGFNERWDNMTGAEQASMGANKRSVWEIATKPFKEAHFATFPEDLIVPCIKAGAPEGGTILDPFMGAGTTAVVARKLNRNYLGFELNPDYINIAESRIDKELGFFK